jgi:hypothetical protein
MKTNKWKVKVSDSGLVANKIFGAVTEKVLDACEAVMEERAMCRLAQAMGFTVDMNACRPGFARFVPVNSF